MEQDKVLNEARLILQSVYDRYRSQGIESVYLHGSILTSNFDHRKSDVDAIAIVDDSTPLELEGHLINELQKENPGIKDFKIRFLYRSELNGNEARSHMATHIPPALLLSDLPYWEWVAGTKVQKIDFVLGMLSLEELICLRVKQVGAQLRSVNDSPNNYKHLLKAVARLCYLLQNPVERFSYDDLQRYANARTKEIVNLVIEVRGANWDKGIFQNELGRLKDFVARIEGEYGC
jgi:hypothetical protein